jgi:type I restriction enzyme, S subunit
MRLPRYERYKASDVQWLGAIPEHWSVVPLRHLTSCLDGKRIPLNSEQRAERPGNVPYWGANCVMDYVETSLFDEDLVLLGEDGAPFFDRLRPVAFFSQGPVWPNNHVHVLRPLGGCAGQFLVHALNTTNFGAFIDGSTRDKLTQGEMNRIPIALPPPAEQSAIATFLDHETAKIDALIAEQEKLIALLAEKRQATISHAVTRGLNPDAPMKDSGVPWLGEVPEHWELKKVKHVKAGVPNSFVDGPFGSNLKSEHFVEDGDVYVIESNFATQNKIDEGTLKTISQSHFETISRSEVKAGDIVIAKIGAQFGKASILPKLDKRSVVSGNSLKLTVNPRVCVTEWVHFQLMNLKAVGEIDLLANGSAQPALSLGAMNTLPVVVPPLPEQIELLEFIVKETDKLDALNAKSEDAIALLKERRSALIAAAVTGQIDVRGFANKAAA